MIFDLKFKKRIETKFYNYFDRSKEISFKLIFIKGTIKFYKSVKFDCKLAIQQSTPLYSKTKFKCLKIMSQKCEPTFTFCTINCKAANEYFMSTLVTE